MISKGIDVSDLSSPHDTTKAIDIFYSCIRESLSLAIPLIGGNEIADNLAKQGTCPNNNICASSYTSKAWVEPKAREIFLGRWKLNIGSVNLSWKCPSEWKVWTYREARAYFRTYLG
jgi:hypothetical protein